MGYRIDLKNINAIGNLVEGNILSFLEQTTSSNDAYQANIKLLKSLIISTRESIYMSDEYYRSIRDGIHDLRLSIDLALDSIEEFKGERQSRFENSKDLIAKLYSTNKYRDLLDFTDRASRLFSTCRVKTILLPGFDRTNLVNQIMRDHRTLRHLVDLHPGDSALILQMEDYLPKEDVAILNVFKNFEKAICQIDQWPGVFVWDNDNSEFLPISSEADLISIFNIIRHEKNPFYLLRKYFNNPKEETDFSYIFHLSDLHFGNRKAGDRMLRLVKILEAHARDLHNSRQFVPIITGDILDSPNQRNLNEFNNFSELLVTKGFSKPIKVLGNHDTDVSGILRVLNRQKAVISNLSGDSKVEVIEDLKIVLLKFNSNTNGEFAQGYIGEQQRIEVGNILDGISNLDRYTLIALLHHHPLEIENPSWNSRAWYEKLLGERLHNQTMKLLDADVFLEWIQNRSVKFVLHGHKHIPIIQRHLGIPIIAAGSSTGIVEHTDPNKTYMSYNLIKYSHSQMKPVSCSILAEEVAGGGTKNILTQLL